MCFLLYLYDYEVIRNSFFRVYADRKAHAEGGEDGGCESEGVDIAVDKRGNYAHGAQGDADGGKLKCSRGLLFAQ